MTRTKHLNTPLIINGIDFDHRIRMEKAGMRIWIDRYYSTIVERRPHQFYIGTPLFRKWGMQISPKSFPFIIQEPQDLI